MKNQSLSKIAFSVLISIILAGCMSAAEHQQSLHSSQEREFTLGRVQARISKGMSQASVAEALGSPNIVTKDDLSDETWIYDKIASEASYSSDKGGTSGIGGALADVGSTLLLGGLGGNYSRSAGASATSKKTLTVIIKFDKQRRVKDFSYHSSRF